MILLCFIFRASLKARPAVRAERARRREDVSSARPAGTNHKSARIVDILSQYEVFCDDPRARLGRKRFHRLSLLSISPCEEFLEMPFTPFYATEFPLILLRLPYSKGQIHRPRQYAADHFHHTVTVLGGYDEAPPRLQHLRKGGRQFLPCHSRLLQRVPY